MVNLGIYTIPMDPSWDGIRKAGIFVFRGLKCVVNSWGSELPLRMASRPAWHETFLGSKDPYI